MRAALTFFLANAAMSISVIFIPLLAQDLGAGSMMTGAIVSVYGLMSLISFYVFGWVADRRGRLFLIRCGMAVSALAFLAQLWAVTDVSLLAVRALCGFAIGIFYSALVMYGVDGGAGIGRFTSYESLGWAAGTLAAGIIASFDRIFAISALLFLLGFFSSLGLAPAKEKRVKVPLLPFDIIKRNWGIYVPFLLRDTGAFAIWAFFPIFLADLGASMFWVGVLFFMNTGSQFVFKQYVDDYDNRILFRVGLAVSALVFFLYAAAPSFWWLIPVQIVLGFAWSTLSVGAMGQLTQKNHEKATVIGLFSSGRSFARILGPLIAGILVLAGGFPLLMAFAGASTLVGLWVNMRAKN